MKKNRKRSVIVTLSAIFMLFCVGCSTNNEGQSEKNKSEIVEDDSNGKIIDSSEDEKSQVTEIQVFKDRNFTNGFNVKSQTDGVSVPLGKIEFDSTSNDPNWNIAQWYCGYYHKDDKQLYDKYNILNGKRTDNGMKHTFVDESKKVSVDTETGELYMRLEGTKEYTAPREAEQPWPHLLFEYETSDTFYLKELKSLRFNMEFELTKMESAFESESQIDDNFHTAQFVYYIIVRNTNVDSPDFNNFIWFGLNLYDARWEIVPAYASQDSGKEINTGAFIYQPISSTFCKYPTKVGEPQNIDYDLLPRIKDALKSAQQAGYLVNTKWEDLSLGGGNFGFEVTGTYDIAVEISTLDLWAGK